MNYKSIVKAFWSCGDSQIVQFAQDRANLNKKEREVLHLVLDECLTQEMASEKMEISTRCFQEYWHSAIVKLCNIKWVVAIAKEEQSL